MSADVWHAAKDGAGHDRRGREGAARAVEGAEDSASNGARDLAQGRGYAARRGRGNRGERHDAVRAGRDGMGEAARVRDSGVTSNPQSPLARTAQIAIAPETGPGSDRRLHADESRHRAENGAEHAFYRCDGAARQSLRELDDLRGADKSEVTPARRADSEGSRGVSASAAEHALRQTGHDLPAALVMLKTGANAVAARRSLAEIRRQCATGA